MWRRKVSKKKIPTKDRFEGYDNGRVVDKQKKTVYSPKQVAKMYKESQKAIKKGKE